jgi:hypothetical protein
MFQAAVLSACQILCRSDGPVVAGSVSPVHIVALHATRGAQKATPRLVATKTTRVLMIDTESPKHAVYTATWTEESAPRV